MKLTDLNIQVRQRSAWEAIDLGFALVQQHWKALMPPYFLLLLLIALCVWLILPEAYLPIAGLVVWWLKPLFDRLLLYMLSRQLFNETPHAADAFSALPQLIWQTGLFSALTYRRLSLSRSYILPIWQLEGLRGKPLKERKAVMYLQGHSHALWLTMGCIHLEFIVVLSLYALILMFDPTGATWEHIKNLFRGDVDIDSQYWRMLLDFTFYLLAILVIEPFYVAAGFMLYINRRTQLEAWDIELAFRNLGERLTQLAKTGASTLPSLVLLLVFASSYFSSTPAFAQYTESEHEFLAEERLPPEQAATTIKAVMALDEFNNLTKVKTWVAKDKQETERSNHKLSEGVIQLIASLLKSLLWIAAVVAVILALVYRQKILSYLAPFRKQTKPITAPEILFGLDIRPESLPADIAGTARQLWQAGQAREALSLLYRGALVILTHEEQLAIHTGHTEGDILKLAKPSTEVERYHYLRTLTKLWQTIAYAHRSPAPQEIEPLLAGWNQFQAPRLAAQTAEGQA
ncbi:hypothetical protein [uncultured Thiothrix sp.]|uniref:hypothetical protein n=1 Tax=uncultured Thiothrix sp. TaxID=223185 RepID=UPI0026231E54|nr:hypothetical protein [uncultured Thiothrix sp.]HMT94271.1 hypothetical protein [Thiolinea sp.]